METVVDGESHLLCGNGIRKKPFDWDLNEWKWDGELFIATPLTSVAASNGMPSTSFSGTDEAGASAPVTEKRRRLVGIEEADQHNGDGSLSLETGRFDNPIVGMSTTNVEDMDGRSQPRVNGNSSSGPTCQVDGCGADLTSLKDYHKRHKVCELHAKATVALVRNVRQRFCQQCSRFHLLQEFDEGKRSCRRRLEGHNKRRRKPAADNSAVGVTLTDERSSGSILLSVLQILSNIQSGSSDQRSNQESLSHFLRNLANICGSSDARSLSQILQVSQNSCGTRNDGTLNFGTTVSPGSARPPELSTPLCSTSQAAQTINSQGPRDMIFNGNSARLPLETNGDITSQGVEMMAQKAKSKAFDLNSMYVDVDAEFPDSRQSSPQETNDNSASTSGQSLSSSNGDTQCRTDRITFKLFGKDPHNLPPNLRGQILAWLSNSPTDIESYIRPGCLILTIYLALDESAWGVICSNFSLCLSKLFNCSNDNFWRAGWIYARVEDSIALIYDGDIIMDTLLPHNDEDFCNMWCVRPIAAPCSSQVNFTIKGLNLVRLTTRILCSFGGHYLVVHPTESSAEGDDVDSNSEGCDILRYSCCMPDAIGRGFLELDDEGICNEFFPIIVAEPDVCSELRMLESTIDIFTVDNCTQDALEVQKARTESIDFLNELGWLLRRSHRQSHHTESNSYICAFHSERFRRLVAFAMGHDWCAVVKKLMDILFSSDVHFGELSPWDLILSENLLHTAVRRNCRAMVELLLRYTPGKRQKWSYVDGFLFRPDLVAFSGVTPLHIAATSRDARDVLDALTNDPNMVGIKAWKTARDSSGFTPEDYARAQGHHAFLDLVQNKINRKNQLVITIPSHILPTRPKSAKTALDILRLRSEQPRHCALCSEHQLKVAGLRSGRRLALARPMLLATLAIAAVCICVGLLLKLPPEVNCVWPSFRWELLHRGTI